MTFGTDRVRHDDLASRQRAGRYQEGVLRVLAPSGDSAVWVGRTDEYVVELVDAEEGEVLQRVERVAPWYTGGSLDPEAPFQEEPKPRLRSLWDDGAGRLWVLLTVAAEDWTLWIPSSNGSGDRSGGRTVGSRLLRSSTPS